MHLRSKAVAFGCAQRIFCQSAASGAKLNIVDILPAAHSHPQISQPQADEFAEHLANFWRGDEVAFFAQRIAAGVIARVAFGHVVGKTDRARFADQATECCGQINRRLRWIDGMNFGLRFWHLRWCSCRLERTNAARLIDQP